MAKLYMRIQKAEDTDRDGASVPLVETQGFTRARGMGIDMDDAVALAEKLGFEIIPEWFTYKPSEWPLTAVAYNTVRGGRSSQPARFPCRKIT